MVAQTFQALPSPSLPRTCGGRVGARPFGSSRAARQTPRRRAEAGSAGTGGQGEASSSAQGSGHTDLSGQAEQLMEADPVTRERLERVRKAAQLVAELQAQKAALDAETTAANAASAWEAQSQERRQAQAASERGATADVQAALDKLEAAQAQLKSAVQEQQKWSAAADEMAERIESAKAGALGGAAAAASSLPFALASGGGASLAAAGSLAAVLVSGALLGVTYRYVVRQDLGNSQLKGGVAAAFGLVRGLAQAEELLKPSLQAGSLSLDAAGAAAVAAGEGVLAMGLAAAALELAMRRGLLRPFGSAGGQP